MLKAWWKRLVFMALSVAVPIVANVFRAYGIIMLAYLSGFEIAVDVDHLVYGGLFLSLVTLIPAGHRVMDARCRCRRAGAARARREPGAAAPASRSWGGWRPVALACVAGLVVLVAMRGYAGWGRRRACRQRQGPQRAGSDRPLDPGRWSGPLVRGVPRRRPGGRVALRGRATAGSRCSSPTTPTSAPEPSWCRRRTACWAPAPDADAEKRGWRPMARLPACPGRLTCGCAVPRSARAGRLVVVPRRARQSPPAPPWQNWNR